MTIVDYINRRGCDSSFAARKELWTHWKPAEEYLGAAAQNTELLEVPKRHFDEGPTVTVTTETVTAGDVVKVNMIGASVCALGIPRGTKVRISDCGIAPLK